MFLHIFQQKSYCFSTKEGNTVYYCGTSLTLICKMSSYKKQGSFYLILWHKMSDSWFSIEGRRMAFRYSAFTRSLLESAFERNIKLVKFSSLLQVL